MEVVLFANTQSYAFDIASVNLTWRQSYYLKESGAGLIAFASASRTD
jgi:hypothetical protein